MNRGDRVPSDGGSETEGIFQREIQKVLKEKDQFTADLTSIEKSLSDLFKWFERQKEVIKRYAPMKNHCFEDHIVGIEKEDQG